MQLSAKQESKVSFPRDAGAIFLSYKGIYTVSSVVCSFSASIVSRIYTNSACLHKQVCSLQYITQSKSACLNETTQAFLCNVCMLVLAWGAAMEECVVFMYMNTTQKHTGFFCASSHVIWRSSFLMREQLGFEKFFL